MIASTIGFVTSLVFLLAVGARAAGEGNCESDNGQCEQDEVKSSIFFQMHNHQAQTNKFVEAREEDVKKEMEIITDVLQDVTKRVAAEQRVEDEIGKVEGRLQTMGLTESTMEGEFKRISVEMKKTAEELEKKKLHKSAKIANEIKCGVETAEFVKGRSAGHLKENKVTGAKFEASDAISVVQGVVEKLDELEKEVKEEVKTKGYNDPSSYEQIQSIVMAKKLLIEKIASEGMEIKKMEEVEKEIAEMAKSEETNARGFKHGSEKIQLQELKLKAKGFGELAKEAEAAEKKLETGAQSKSEAADGLREQNLKLAEEKAHKASMDGDDAAALLAEMKAKADVKKK